MLVLGIETSCDETAAAVVQDGKEILSSVVASSLKFHKEYGGIVPEIASRMQLETIANVVDSALKKGGIKLKDIDLMSVTCKPGLLGSLLVGVSFAQAAGFASKVPLLGIDHLHGHIYAAFLSGRAPALPFIALVVSGGHTSLFYIEDFDRISLLGSTLDDACGEAFDKVAKILGLGYPGGPYIEKAGQKGNPRKYKFACSNTKKPLDFSFSGIKTALWYAAGNKRLGQQDKKDMAASFQETVINTLIEKSLLACRMKKVNRLAVGGGVAANNRLRELFFQRGKASALKVYFPPRELCLDNAAMVAGLGYRLFKKGGRRICFPTNRLFCV
ncbi:MAG: tRNA (adenosine(37)-N6)-threonylcarbamoyltransferase complex transferase subunit TsaD [Candidatus Omnitrophota bacterium]|jgi:N6-L-threonylcarbamoyladenine synthase